MAGEKYTGAPGPSQVAGWQNQIIKPGATVSGNQPVGGTTSNPAAVELYNMTRQERQQLALALKNAGYRVPTNGVFSDALVNAYTSINQAAQAQAMQLGQPYDKTFFTSYLARETAANVGTGTSGVSKNIQTRVYTDTDAKKLINSVIRDQLGRDASAAEIARYTKDIQAKQAASPTVTTYSTTGGVTTSKTTGGINEQQYLIDKVAGTDESKANRVLGYYETFMNALGRG